jgi:predicted DNA-binding transcriptional regulator AlpA
MLNINGEKYLVEKEISNKFGMSLSWFRQARYKGISPKYHKLRGRVYYREDEVHEWFKQNMQSSE